MHIRHPLPPGVCMQSVGDGHRTMRSRTFAVRAHVSTSIAAVIPVCSSLSPQKHAWTHNHCTVVLGFIAVCVCTRATELSLSQCVWCTRATELGTGWDVTYTHSPRAYSTRHICRESSTHRSTHRTHLASIARAQTSRPHAHIRDLHDVLLPLHPYTVFPTPPTALPECVCPLPASALILKETQIKAPPHLRPYFSKLRRHTPSAPLSSCLFSVVGWF